MNKYPQIEHLLLAEDIRQELGGKITILGFWGHKCKLVSKAPGMLESLGLYAYVRLSEDSEHKIKLQLSVPTVRDIYEQEILLPAKNQNMQYANLVFRLTNVPIVESGNITVIARIDDESSSQKTFSLYIELAEDSSIKGIQLPSQ